MPVTDKDIGDAGSGYDGRATDKLAERRGALLKSYEEEAGLLGEVLECLVHERVLIQQRNMDALIASLRSREAILGGIRRLREERAGLIGSPGGDEGDAGNDAGSEDERLKRIEGHVAAIYREIIEIDQENTGMLWENRDRIELELRAILKARDMAGGYGLLSRPGPRFIVRDL
ncbi:MAG: hypothetical protein HPY71_10100 [Firmicutes bacterium]|nr:hypothetical protein [Bacillota bacterium]